MITIKLKNRVKIKRIIVILVIMLIVVPVLAKQQRDSGSKSSSSSARSQPAPSQSISQNNAGSVSNRVERQALRPDSGQALRPSSGQVRSAPNVTNVQRPANIVRSNAGISSIARSSRPQSNSGISRMTGPTVIRGTAKSGISQPNLGRQTPSLSVPSKVEGSNTVVTDRGSAVVKPQSSVVSPPSSVPSAPLRASIGRNIISPTITNPSASFRARIPAIASPSTLLRTSPSTQPGTGILESAQTIIDSRTRSAEPLSSRRISPNKTTEIAERIGRQDLSSQRTSKSQLSSQTTDIRSSIRSRLDEALGRSRGDNSATKQNPSHLIVNRRQSAESQITESQTNNRSSNGSLRAPAATVRQHGELGAIGKKTAGNKAEAKRTQEKINLRVVDSLRASSAERHPAGGSETRARGGERQRERDTEGKTIRPESGRANGSTSRPEGSRRDDGVKSRTDIRPSDRARSEHRPASRDKHRYEHVYWDRHNQLQHRIIWPRYRFVTYYNRGPHFAFSYVYPFYLRRYVFVSLGGYWPADYCYLRYYWYGYHPYWWYGYYPVAREVAGDTYNYYTYNYYYENDGSVPSVSAQAIDGITPVDHNTFADIREKLAQQAAGEPAEETTADVQFDAAVRAFEAGDYEAAIEKFDAAGKIAADDMVLPFAYSQALFANEQYVEAADVLRAALARVSPEKEGVFYPRGLYSDDDVLFEQIEHLKQRVESYSFDADLQLLLGYQLLGVGEIDKAVEPLQHAGKDMKNATSAKILLDLLAKMKPIPSAMLGTGTSGAEGTDNKTENK